MRTAYLILPDTTLAVSKDGGEFKPHTTRKPLQFDQPDEVMEEEMIFSHGPWRFLVKRAEVTVSRWGGGYGENQFGV